MATYRTDDREGLHIYDVAELFGCVGFDSPVDALPDPRLPRGEWYCRNQDCVIREVTIDAALIEKLDRLPATMRCPACSEVLAFHHWLSSTTLLLVSED